MEEKKISSLHKLCSDIPVAPNRLCLSLSPDSVFTILSFLLVPIRYYPPSSQPTPYYPPSLSLWYGLFHKCGLDLDSSQSVASNLLL